MNKTNESIALSFTVNTTFSDQVIKLTKEIERCTTAEIGFHIAPVSISGDLLPTISITDSITPSCKYSNFWMTVHCMIVFYIKVNN